MKKNRHISLFALALTFCAMMTLASCDDPNGEGGDTPLSSRMVGTWELVDLTQTRSAKIGDELIEVYIVFTADLSAATTTGKKAEPVATTGTFTLYQMLGKGEFRAFDGKWNLDGTTLTGTYSDGKKWGASYEVSVSDDDERLTLAAPSETCVYTRGHLPNTLVR